MKNILKFLLPLVLLTGGISFIFIFEFYLKDKVNTIPVLIASENIQFKEMLTSENLTIRNVRRSQAVNGAYLRMDEKKLSEMFGKLAAIDIQKGTQIYPALIDHFNLVPNEIEGEFIAPIPNQWIFAVPGSLRRSYYADFYVISEGSRKIGPILTDVRVVYTKDSSNREVRNLQDNRYDATANISEVEIIASAEMLSTLSEYIEQGYKLYITYKTSN
jgi:hypothetical protein